MSSGSLSPAGRQTVIDALRDAWARNPELRLGQLVGNATCETRAASPFYIEDGELLAALRCYGREAE